LVQLECRVDIASGGKMLLHHDGFQVGEQALELVERADGE
jgi:hypothetical protein